MSGTARPLRLAAIACAAVALTAMLAACGASTPPPGVAAGSPPTSTVRAPSRLLDPAAFAAAVQTPGTTTINVHVPYAGDVPGTDLSIPFDRIGAETAQLPADHHAPLALYCRTGPMSADAARTLAGQGYTDIVELSGGMNAWVGSGRALVSAPGRN